MRFVESEMCLSRKHCNICRQKHGGLEWRKLVGRLHEIENENFSCPQGLPWIEGEVPEKLRKAFAGIKPEVPKELLTATPDKSTGQMRREAAAHALALGKVLKYNEFYLRQKLASTSPIVLGLDALSESEKRGGCRGCRAKKLFRALGETFNESTDDDKLIVQSIVETA